MKKLIIVSLLTIGTAVHAGDYKKRNGILSIFPESDLAKFSINASHGDGYGVCEVEGKAILIGAEKGLRNQWVYNDQSSTCAVVISEQKNGTMKVITDKCENYCGVTAIGSFDGDYRKQ